MGRYINLQTASAVITSAAIVWAVLTILINFIIPEQWFFKYISLETRDVEQGEKHPVTGVRWAAMPMRASGVDQILPTRLNEPADRLEWGQGSYPVGFSTSTWWVPVHVDPGKYKWRNSNLLVWVLYIFPLSIDNRPVSNVFEVYN